VESHATTAPETAGDPPVKRPLDVVFVGGTGRSGTHVIGKLVSRSPRFGLVPVEVRFHVEERGFPGLLDGTVSKDDFLRRMRGFWWRGFQTNRLRGMHRFVDRERFDAALDAFADRFDSEPEAACRELFLDLLSGRAPSHRARPGLVEQSTDNVAAAPTLTRLFPEARFIHAVRDGRDASASRTSQLGALVYPRTRRQGLEWWEHRLRRIDAGSHAIPEGRLLTVSLDELVLMYPRHAAQPLADFLDVLLPGRMKLFARRRMNADRANAARWRRGLSIRRAADIERAYAEALDRLEADGIACVPLLRRAFDRSQGKLEDTEPWAYLEVPPRKP